jgi:hypothetical protein
MKYIKKFEFGNTPLFKCDDFKIDSHYYFKDNDTHLHLYLSIGILINKYKKYLNNRQLRSILLFNKDRLYFNQNIKDLDSIIVFRISNINGLFDGKNSDPNMLYNIPSDVYKNLIFKYYPIMQNATEESVNLGDLIDKYKIICKNFNNDVKLHINMSKYNL